MTKDYQLTRSDRRTLSLSVSEDGTVRVRAPIRCPEREIDAFVSAHTQWIQKQRGAMRDRANSREKAKDGGYTLFLGEAYPVVSRVGVRRATFDGAQFLVPQNSAETSDALSAWYKEHAKEIITGRLSHYAALMGVQCTGLRITSARTRWGSCSAKNAVCFSYRLLCMPLSVVDYIVVHELSHIRHKNHSKAFYAEVQRYMPDYKTRVKALNAYRNQLPF